MIIKFTAPRSWKHGTERQTLMALSDLYASTCMSSSYLRPVHFSISFIISLGLERNGWWKHHGIEAIIHTSKLSLPSVCSTICLIRRSRSTISPCWKDFSITFDANLFWLMVTTCPANLVIIWLLSWDFPLSRTCCKRTKENNKLTSKTEMYQTLVPHKRKVLSIHYIKLKTNFTCVT